MADIDEALQGFEDCCMAHAITPPEGNVGLAFAPRQHLARLSLSVHANDS